MLGSWSTSLHPSSYKLRSRGSSARLRLGGVPELSVPRAEDAFFACCRALLLGGALASGEKNKSTYSFLKFRLQGRDEEGCRPFLPWEPLH